MYHHCMVVYSSFRLVDDTSALNARGGNSEMKFGHGSKSQADQIAIIKLAGWLEATDTSLPWRWFDPKLPVRMYYTLSHAVEVIEAQKNGLSSDELSNRKQHRAYSPADGRTPD